MLENKYIKYCILCFFIGYIFQDTICTLFDSILIEGIGGDVKRYTILMRKYTKQGEAEFLKNTPTEELIFFNEQRVKNDLPPIGTYTPGYISGVPQPPTPSPTTNAREFISGVPQPPTPQPTTPQPTTPQPTTPTQTQTPTPSPTTNAREFISGVPQPPTLQPTTPQPTTPQPTTPQPTTPQPTTPTQTQTQTPTNVPGFIPEDSQPTGEIIANVVDQPPTECTDENTIMVSEGTKCSDYSTDFHKDETYQNTCNNAVIYDEQFGAYYGCQANLNYFGITCTDIEEPIAMKNGDNLESTSPMPTGYSCIHDTIDNQYLIV